MMLDMPGKWSCSTSSNPHRRPYRILASRFPEMALTVTGSEEQAAGIILVVHMVPF